MLWKKGRPKPRICPQLPISHDDRKFASEEIQRWIDSGYVRELHGRKKKEARVALPAFAIAGSSKKRLAIDARCANEHYQTRSVKCEDLRDLAMALRPNDRLISFDVKDGRHHLALTREAQKRLSFRVLGRTFMPIALPFGWSLAPYCFAKFARPAMKHLRAQGFRATIFADDVAAASPCRNNQPCAKQEATAGFAKAQKMLEDLGTLMRPEKGEREGSQRLMRLGLLIDAKRQLFLAPPQKLGSLQRQASSLLECAKSRTRRVPARVSRSFVGTCMSLSLAAPLTRFRTRELRHSLGSRRYGEIRLSHAAIRNLRFWRAISRQNGVGRALWREPSQGTHASDASDIGWGGGSPNVASAAGFFTSESSRMHINAKEMRAITHASRSLGSLMPMGSDKAFNTMHKYDCEV